MTAELQTTDTEKLAQCLLLLDQHLQIRFISIFETPTVGEALMVRAQVWALRYIHS